MKRLLLLSVLISLLVSCSSRKHIEKQLYAGNYDVAITKALKKLENNKDKKRKQQFIVMLEDAYEKVVERDLRIIDHLKKDGNPEQFKTIYEMYSNLSARQEAIKPLLPLKIGKKYLNLQFNDYSNDLVDYRYKVSDYLIDEGITLLDTDDKLNARKAFRMFKYIDDINPNFEEVHELMNEAHLKGIDFVKVSIENHTHQILPIQLENELLDFSTYGLNDFWTVYHNNIDESVTYDFDMALQLKRISVSPERILEKQLLREKQIVDGWEYQLDENGNVLQDSLGNDIKIDRIINVRARLFEFNQLKTAQVIGKVVLSDLNTHQLVDSFSLDSEFIFENNYARLRGDERALNDHDRRLLNNRRIQFPSDSEMVFDTGEDLKRQFKSVLHQIAYN